jgi:ankyrin repeat protein
MTAEEFHAAKLKKIELELEKDPSIASCRSINAAARPMDGWTPLHAAASVGHNDAIEILLKSGHCSAWDVDLQGRTPLALAAEAQHRRTCALLRKYMKESARHDVVGAHAPVDLVGRTPLGWLSKGAAHTEIADEVGHSALTIYLY